MRNFVQVFFPPLGQQPLVFPARLTLNRWEIFALRCISRLTGGFEWVETMAIRFVVLAA